MSYLSSYQQPSLFTVTEHSGEFWKLLKTSVGPHLQALELTARFLGFCLLLWNNSEKATNTSNMDAIWAELRSEILPRCMKDKTVSWKGRYPEEINPTSTEWMSWLGKRGKQCRDRFGSWRTLFLLITCGSSSASVFLSINGNKSIYFRTDYSGLRNIATKQ